jgi:hypothetical protein
MDMKLKASPLHTVSLRCASRSPSPVLHTAQIERHSPLQRVVNGISCCALAIATALLVSCGDIESNGGSLSGGNGNIVPGGGSLSGGDIFTTPPQDPTVISPQDPTVVSVAQCGDGLAAQDLAGRCRALPPTMGALEASNGT